MVELNACSYQQNSKTQAMEFEIQRALVLGMKFNIDHWCHFTKWNKYTILL